MTPEAHGWLSSLPLLLAGLGYAHEGDLGIVGREAFATPPGYGAHDHHLYVCAPDWPGHADQIDFRDYLRAHVDAAARYEAVKRDLAARFGHDRHAYTDAKGDFLWTAIREADQWASITGWRPGASDA